MVVAFFLLIPLIIVSSKAQTKCVDLSLEACAYALLLAVLVLAGFATPRAIPCWVPETRVERVGPVTLPDPSQGLNQFLNLNSSSASVTLKLCTTHNLQFYIGLPDDCARLGEPYGERLPYGEPTRRSECPGGVDLPLGLAMFFTAALVFALILAFILETCKWVGNRCFAKRVAPAADNQATNNGAV